MRTSTAVQALGLLFAGLAKAAPYAGPLDLGPELAARDEALDLTLRDDVLDKRAGPTCNTPSNRACWTSSFNINTDYEASIPAGIVRPYTLVLTEQDSWTAPDGTTKKSAMLINGTFPGPTLTADWGDTFQVTVINKLKTNGTSFHWHGVRMLNNNVNDGVNGITQCPIPPGQSQVYTFRAEQYGSSWYHSHFSAQYGNGVVGTLLINGPQSLPYDIDLGVFPITDWYHDSADDIIESIIPPPGAAPLADNVLFNGSNVSPSGGNYARVKLTPGKRHLLRIINTSVENNFAVSLVGHDMTVIQTDFVPVNAYTTSSVFVGLGQRYHVTIDASKAVDNYWFNVTYPDNGICGGCKLPKPAAIFQYVGANATALPTNPGTALPNSKCEDSTNYVPIVTRTAPQASFTATANNDVQLTLATDTWRNQTRVYWHLNGKDMNITWGDPTLEFVAQGNMNYPDKYNVFQVPQQNQWAYWVIENEFGLPHPVHLHGHDFLILGRTPAVDNPFTIADRRFNATTDLSSLNFNNPTRRDVTMLPGNGWIVVAFKTDNPGAWLFHCHIAWHVSQGLSIQFLERVQDIPGSVNVAAIQDICNKWNAYYPGDPTKQIDSGL